MAKMAKFVFDRVENIPGKKKEALIADIPPSSKMLSKGLFLMVVKSHHYVV